jgi:hypothetical protein
VGNGDFYTVFRNKAMTEPMSRESVLAVLDNWMGNSNVERNKAIAAVAALYERCEALERAVKRAHCHAYGERMEGKFIRSNYHMIPSAEWKAIFAAASDAEGGG